MGVSRTRLLLAASALAVLAGCMENDGTLFKSAPSQAGASGGSTRLVERDVEAPEVFQATEAGLWDGRPSLGGVWVAHPDVTEPERALIRNTANGKFVIGALFRPSLDRPGPRFQVSSDAAEALSMLAGQPQNLNVTALRREEVPTEEPQAEAVVAEAPAPDMPAPEAVETATLDPVASAGAAIDAAEAAATAPVETADVAAEAKPKRRWFWQKKEPEADIPATDTLAAAEVSEEPLPAAAPAPQASAPSPKPAPRPVSQLDKPYLQIGIFSVEKNARNTAVAMRQAGMIPEVLDQTSKGKRFWRVIVGPATNTEERAILLQKVKAAGFTDAYAVTN